MRRERTSTIAARLAAAVAIVDAITSISSLTSIETLGASRRNATSQTLKPGVDVVAEDAHANQHHDGDRRDQQSVLDDVLPISRQNKNNHLPHESIPPVPPKE